MRVTMDLPAEVVADLRDRARRSGVEIGDEVASLIAVALEALGGDDLADGEGDESPEEPPF